MDVTAQLRCRGIRGATTASANTEAEILGVTRELLTRLISANQVSVDDVAAIIFTATPDLNATFPARAARELGYVNTPLMCGQEISVPGAPEKCLRILLLVNTAKGPEQITHVYLRGAAALRQEPPSKSEG